MKFKYSARTKQGELQTGFVEAASKELAFGILTSHELYVLSLELLETSKWHERILNFFNRVRPTDLMIFTRQFATLLDAQISLNDSLRNLYKQTKNVLFKETVSELASDVDSGLLLSQAMERHSHVFSNFYVSMVRSAEITGRLEEVVSFLADFLEKEVSLLSRVRSALIYPGVVIALFGIVVGIMVGVVFPQLEPIFSESSVPVPPLTKVLLGAGNFVADWWLALLILLLVFAAVIVDYFRSSEGKAVFDDLQIRLPILGELYKKLYVARFAEAAGVLIRGGIPIAQALEISGHNTGSIIYRDALHEIAEGVRGGQLMSQALADQEKFFPPLVSQMVAVGEATGKLEALLSRVSAFYTREIDNIVVNLVELIQPSLMIFIGVLVGLLFAAVLLPIYNLAQVF